MARYRGPVCRLCRREGCKLYLKGERCYTDKCAVDKRKSAPGQHGMTRAKLSDYGVQLREKQKLKRIFSIPERQFRNIFAKAYHSKNKTGDALLSNLALRLDSVVYLLGFTSSRNAARQLIRHNHIFVNNKRTNIPSAVLKINDVVSLSVSAQTNSAILAAIEISKRASQTVPVWLNVNYEKYQGTVTALPNREDINLPVQERFIVELYSK